ncbi:NERD domain-containing protein [Microbacterium sp. JZ70]
MDETQWLWVAGAGCGVLLIAVVVLVIANRRGRERARRRVAEVEVASATRAAELTRAHEDQVATLAAEHESRLAAVSDDHERETMRLRAETAASMEVARRTRETLATGLKWEAASRRLILAACEQLGLRGSLHTNVVFMPSDALETRTFVTQIDHVLLLDGARLVIENKRWQGVLFDGVRPSAVHEAFGKLVDENDLGEHFAVQLRRDPESPQSITVNRHLGERAPVVQVRRQAQQLSRFVEQELSEPIWFDTCVLYSHERAEAHLRQRDQSSGGASTWVVAGADGLIACLESFASRTGNDDTRRDDAALFETLSALGADATRFGPDES